MDFKEWFCLNGRESFTIDPKVNPDDVRFYFGREEIKNRIKAQLRRSFVEPGVPKMVIYGSFGSGKTQTLFHLEHYLQNECPKACRHTPRILHLDLEMHSRSDHKSWHLQLVETLGKSTVSAWIDRLFSRTQNLDTELRRIFGNVNIAEAAKNLRAGGDIGLLAWRWFCGYDLKANELERLNVTRSLGDLGAGDMVNALVGIGRLAERNEEKLIFLMDEAEQFKNVKTGDATESLHTYLRKLAEPSNSSVGFIIASYALTLDDMAELLVRADVRTRIGENNFVEIPPLPSIKDVEIFLKELLAELVEQNKAEEKIQKESLGVSLETYPFTAEAFEMLCEFASEDPTKALPRNLIKAVNECAISAWDERKPIIEPNIVNEIAPLIFG
jgi:DNA polymerase III delta prime subunit